MTKILFVCTGNICRSPTAEAVARHFISTGGLDGLIETPAEGGYRLATSAVPLPGGEAAQFALDGYLRLGEEQVR